MNASESNFRAWLAKASNDLLNVENNLQADRVPWDTVCFHAQQAVEKTLKAFLVYHGRTPKKTHDLVALLAESVDIDASLVGLQSDCRRLTVFAVGSRYPDDLFVPEEADGKDMARTAKEICAEVMKRLPQ